MAGVTWSGGQWSAILREPRNQRTWPVTNRARDSFKYLLANSAQWVGNSRTEPFTTFYNLFVEPVRGPGGASCPDPGLQLSRDNLDRGAIPWSVGI